MCYSCSCFVSIYVYPFLFGCLGSGLLRVPTRPAAVSWVWVLWGSLAVSGILGGSLGLSHCLSRVPTRPALSESPSGVSSCSSIGSRRDLLPYSWGPDATCSCIGSRRDLLPASGPDATCSRMVCWSPRICSRMSSGPDATCSRISSGPDATCSRIVGFLSRLLLHRVPNLLPHPRLPRVGSEEGGFCTTVGGVLEVLSG